MVICLKRGADCLHIQLMHPKTSSPLASFKSRLAFTFLVPVYLQCKLYVVLEKRPLSGCSRNSSSYEQVSVHAGFRRRRAWDQIAAATLSGNSLRQTVHTHRSSVHQAAKLVAALFRIVRVTAGLAESNAGFMTHVTCRLTANKNRDQLGDRTLGT